MGKEIVNLDTLSTLEIIRKINHEDKKIAYLVEEQLGQISKAVELIVKSFEIGGRLIYVGSGTSGKLAVIDASECPPTFGVDDSMVQGIISGGEGALSGWLEHTEDDEELAVRDLQSIDVNKNDILVGITASGNTPYVRRAMEYGKEIQCKTIGIMCSSIGKIKDICDLTISVDVGEEILMGSTRMKAGTAQKMILNMLSTTSMIKFGKTYLNLMVNVKPINKKLQDRVREMVCLATNANKNKIDEILEKCDYDPKVAIIVIETGLRVEEAKLMLEEHNGRTADVLDNYK
ncbi:N-acetylmuramic acid 6-phosphate etherase [Clostridium acidisoli DSM 12555]|uniref:N-acetylmuramic acid 6-phosphate etherase n=1 Tax=Clostridium acidisoli DSM 12555 TaxID=1121291 RepID=A0A1W1XNL3_9CLOT|nr:N-acetylmuramic acid 6-phosphate etherase [Clostridium acidisoli]SMC25553.1 N-acetylmuramic acid 6-phosphate etherase [Clostridium acidisoli DSM 12555]